MTDIIDQPPRTLEHRLDALEVRLAALERSARAPEVAGDDPRASLRQGAARADAAIRRWYGEQPLLTILATVIAAAILFKIID
jgi:hypothetical protein